MGNCAADSWCWMHYTEIAILFAITASLVAQYEKKKKPTEAEHWAHSPSDN